MTEDEKETEVLNDTNDAFVTKEVTKKLKQLKKEIETPEIAAFKEKLQRHEGLKKEEKNLKAEIKRKTAELHNQTKEVIEQLTDEQIYQLLKEKWITRLIDNLQKLPESIISGLIDQIQNIAKKYETTFFELENEIEETEKQLAAMLDDLEGNEFDMEGLSKLKLLLLGE